MLKTHDLPGLSVAQVAAAAGVAVGSFCSRFDDKNALFAELARQAALAAVADLQHLLGASAMRAWHNWLNRSGPSLARFSTSLDRIRPTR